MKRKFLQKFNILYEDILDEIKGAKVDYELMTDFKKKVQQKIDESTQNNIAFIIKDIIKSFKWNDVSKQDKIDQLKIMCQKKYGKSLTEKLFSK